MTMLTPSKVPRARFRSTTPRPRTIEVAFWITLAGMAAYVIFVVGAGIASAVQTGTPISPGVAVINLFVAVAPTTALIMLARHGERWARGFFTVGAVVIFIRSIVVVVVESVPAASVEALGWIALSIVLIALQATPAVLLWLPASNAYFRTVAEEKRRFRESILR